MIDLKPAALSRGGLLIRGDPRGDGGNPHTASELALEAAQPGHKLIIGRPRRVDLDDQMQSQKIPNVCEAN